MAKSDPLARAVESLRAAALAYPEAAEEFPWGERALKVKGKVFLFLGRMEGGLTLSVKLPVSAAAALELPFAEPTHYGLGKHGWVTAKFEPGDAVPLDLLHEWLDESYRAVAPRAVLARLEESEGEGKPARKAARRKRSAG